MTKTMKFIVAAFGCLLSVTALSAVVLRDHYPQQYVVKTGDTLWGIAGKYLQKPWQWPKIWRSNPRIKNPHKIYPGAVLQLRMINGKPALVMKRNGVVQRTIAAMPLSKIKPLLNASLVFNDRQMETAPYVVSYVGEHLIGGVGVSIYATQVRGRINQRFSIFRAENVYRNPDNHKIILGYGASYVGSARLKRLSEPQVLKLTSVAKEVRVGDRLIPEEKIRDIPYFTPHPPRVPIHGEIISFFDGMQQIGTNQVAVIDKGSYDHVKPGDVLAVFHKGKLIRDPDHRKKERILLPDERIGEIMVFRTFDRVSFALVMNTKQAIYLYDMVHNP